MSIAHLNLPRNTIQIFLAAYLPVTKTYLRTRYQPTLQLITRLRKSISQGNTDLLCNTLAGH
jgi:hypothetical protein